MLLRQSDNAAVGNAEVGGQFANEELTERNVVCHCHSDNAHRNGADESFLKDTYGLERDGKTIDIHLSREDLAGLSNMTTSNAIRTLSNFASEGIVSLEGRSIRIIDEEGLKRISRIG